ncbi:MAG: hypothetical protein KDD69_08595 [Bdellovibrionales bacterium]|nr:hypothetical protein [Bdellovibrionales bacterium]
MAPRSYRSVLDSVRVFPLERVIATAHIEDVEASVAAEFQRLYPLGNELSGLRIGITAVSRQVANYVRLLRAAIAQLRARGATVAVLPAIGSHGKGTAEGAIQTLQHYGITEASVGAPILAGPETEHVATVEGVRVACAKSVLQDLDGVFLFGRVRRHWDIRWAPGEAETLGCYPLESGLSKLFLGMAMLEAKALHDHGERLGWAVQTAARRLLLEPRVNVIGALAVVDTEEEQTALVRGIPFRLGTEHGNPSEFFRREHEVLQASRAFLPWLPFSDEDADLLYLHYFGKPYAGQGADPKIIGRNGGTRNWCSGTPRFHRICASRLIGARDQKQHRGPFNAMGIGSLDFVTRRFYEAVDWELTKLNAVTAGCPRSAEAPRIAETDRAMLEIAIAERPSPLQPARMMFAVSTVWMRLLYLSEAYYEQANALLGFRIRGEPQPIPFDRAGFVDFPAFEHI